MGSSIYLTLALVGAFIGAAALGIYEEKRIAAIKADLAGATARLNTCQEVQGIQDAIDGLSIQDLVNSFTRGANKLR